MPITISIPANISKNNRNCLVVILGIDENALNKPYEIPPRSIKPIIANPMIIKISETEPLFT